MRKLGHREAKKLAQVQRAISLVFQISFTNSSTRPFSYSSASCDSLNRFATLGWSPQGSKGRVGRRQKKRLRESGALFQNLHPASNLTVDTLTAYSPPLYGFLHGYFGRIDPWRSRAKYTVCLELTGRGTRVLWTSFHQCWASALGPE